MSQEPVIVNIYDMVSISQLPLTLKQPDWQLSYCEIYLDYDKSYVHVIEMSRIFMHFRKVAKYPAIG